MKTVTIQIGNSDNKLSQEEWSLFYEKTNKLIIESAKQIHFAAPSYGASPWQNACFVFEIMPVDMEPLWEDIIKLRAEYKQDSIAWTEGETEMI